MDLRPDGKICHREISGNGFCEQLSYKSIKATSILRRPPFVGYRTFRVFFNVNEASVYRALLAFIFSEKIFEGGMTRRDSRHCPQFLNSGNSSEFSISGGPVRSKARDSVLYEQSFLAGFPLFKQRGINYPPTFVGPPFSSERSSLMCLSVLVHKLAPKQGDKL